MVRINPDYTLNSLLTHNAHKLIMFFLKALSACIHMVTWLKYKISVLNFTNQTKRRFNINLIHSCILSKCWSIFYLII